MLHQRAFIETQVPPQAAMIEALRISLEKNGTFGDALAALSGFTARILPDGLQVSTHKQHQTSVVIVPTIAALTCANADTEELAEHLLAASQKQIHGVQLKWDSETANDQKRVSATYPISQQMNLEISCMNEPVDPYFDGKAVASATIIMQLVQSPTRALH